MGRAFPQRDERVRGICAGVVAHEKLPVTCRTLSERLAERADRLLAAKDLT